MTTVIFWDVTLCTLIDRHEHTASIIYPKDGGLSVKLHSVMSHTKVALIFTAMKPSNLKSKTIMIFIMQHLQFV